MRRGNFRDDTVDYAAVGATQAADLMHFPPERSIPAEESWRIVEPILDGATPLEEYEPNTWGPAAAERMTEPGGGWCCPEHFPVPEPSK